MLGLKLFLLSFYFYNVAFQDLTPFYLTKEDDGFMMGEKK
jgi:hypothetical protein